jgi:hypothetical protein
MTIALLPQAKTFDDVGACIYCKRRRAEGIALSNEHIIPLTLGGQLILAGASCDCCSKKIKKFEAFLLNQTLIAVRTHLKLPMYDPKFRPTDLRLGEFDSSGEWPNIDEANLQFKDHAIDQHPFVIMLPDFRRPGLLVGRERTTEFSLRPNLFQIYGSGPDVVPSASRQKAEMRPFSPDGVCREIAKIAHGAACAVLGTDGFDALLPEVILGDAPNLISHLVGTADENSASSNLHEIWLDQEAEFIVAKVQLFARYGFKPYEAVVGKHPST